MRSGLGAFARVVTIPCSPPVRACAADNVLVLGLAHAVTAGSTIPTPCHRILPRPRIRPPFIARWQPFVPSKPRFTGVCLLVAPRWLRFHEYAYRPGVRSSDP